MRKNFLVPALFVALLTSHYAAAQQGWPAKDWPAATPASVGLDEKILAGLDAEIASGKYGLIDSMLVIRHGKAVYDRKYPHDYSAIYGADAKLPGGLNAGDLTGPYNYFNSWWHPFYRRGELHTMQSVTKTVTSVAIGVAVTRGEFPDLDTPILNFFETSKVANIDERKRKVTIRHLLTMSSGLDWDEDLPYSDPKNTGTLMEAGSDWVGFVINRPMAHEPGTVFKYNSGGTQLLSYIFRKATGTDIEEYAAKNLFAPLGITDWFWKRDPTGLIDTEGGLYLKPHDIARIAYLFLKDGVWNGKAVVSPEWVKKSVTPSIDVGTTGVKYGYKWWLYPYGPDNKYLAWSGSGFGGQRPIILPEYDIVIVYTGWNIKDGQPGFPRTASIGRIVEAVLDKPKK